MKHLSTKFPLIKRHTHSTDEEKRAWPLHLKSVKAVALGKRLAILQRLLPDSPHTEEFSRCVELFRQWSQLSLLEQSAFNRQKVTSELTSQDEANIASHECLDGGMVVTRCPGVTPNTRTFSTPEEEKSRRRWITHTPGFNEWMKDRLPRMKLVAPPECMPRVSRAYGICLDFKWYYGQFGLDQDIQQFVIPFGSDSARLRTIPTGASICPALAHAYTEAMVTYWRNKFPVYGTIDVDVYIDNIRLCADDPTELKEAATTFFSITKEMQVECNELPHELVPSKQYVFLGIDYDHIEGTTSISEKTRHKLEKIQRRLTSNEDLEVAELLHMHGVLQYASAVSSSSRAPYYAFLKYMRRLAAKNTPLAEVVRPWTQARQDLTKWVFQEQIRPRRRWRIQQSMNRYEVFTDASDGGWGIVCYKIGTPGCVVVADRWNHLQKALHINVKEAIVVRTALRVLDIEQDAEIHFWVDNTALIHTLERRCSRGFMLNSVIDEIIASPRWHLVRDTRYVATHVNPADPASRIHQLGQETAVTILQQKLRQVRDQTTASA